MEKLHAHRGGRGQCELLCVCGHDLAAARSRSDSREATVVASGNDRSLTMYVEATEMYVEATEIGSRSSEMYVEATIICAEVQKLVVEATKKV